MILEPQNFDNASLSEKLSLHRFDICTLNIKFPNIYFLIPLITEETQFL